MVNLRMCSIKMNTPKVPPLDRSATFMCDIVVSKDRVSRLLKGFVTHKSTVARTVMCRQDGRGRFPVLLDDHSKCRTNSPRKSQLS